MPQTNIAPFSAGPIGAGLTQPMLPAAGTGGSIADADPGIWQKFLKAMKDDPNFQQSLMVTGLSLLGDPQPGESGFGTFSRSALTGVKTLDSLRQRDEVNRRRDTALEIQQQGASESVRRTDESIRRGDIAETSLEQRGIDSKARLKIMTDTLAESRRRTDIQFGVQGASGAGSSTGAERQIANNKDALMAGFPELFPDDEGGSAKAQLIASGIMPFLGDPERAASGKIQLFGMLVEQNQFAEQPLTVEELQESASNLYGMFSAANLVSTDIDQIDDGEDLRDKQVTMPDGGVATVIPIGNGKFILRKGDSITSRSRAFTRADIESRLTEGT